MATPEAQAAEHIIPTQHLDSSHLPLRVHPIISSRQRYQLPVGDQTGLTKTGVHFCRLPPNTISTTLHWHTHEDEWFFIVDAADNAALLVQDVASQHGLKKEIKVSRGDFVGFPAGLKLAHALSSGDGDLIYLTGGSREPLDVSNYPEVNRRRVIARGEGGESYSWAVDDIHVIHQEN